ncbi:MAG: DUF4006 family protein [archaeon]
MKKGDKSGQFYLIAAILILSIVIGLVTITNYSQQTESTRIYELSEDLKIESGKILDHVASTGDTAKIKEFAKDFDDYAGAGIDIYYITGPDATIEAYKYVDGVETPIIEDDFKKEDGNVIIMIDFVEYTFKINPGENFYFVMVHEIGEEKYVITN